MAAGAPTNLTATPNAGGLKLSWDKVASATSYTIRQGLKSGGPYIDVATGVPGEIYLHQALSPKTTYYYVVLANDATGQGPASNEVSGRPGSRFPGLDFSLDAGTIAGLVLMGLATWLLLRLFGSTDLLQQIKDQAYARGLITFIVTFGTIVLAFVLIGSALFADSSSDDRFRRGREVFSVLAGVLGTIVGFYFGAADKDVKRVALSEVRVTPSSLAAYAHGGTPPYRYSIELNGGALATRQQSLDGWIVVAGSIKERDKVQITVVDKTDQEASVSKEIAPDDLKLTPSSPPPAQ